MPEPDALAHEPATAPKRVMGFRDLVLFYVVTGVSLRWIATAASHGPSSLVVWILGWLFLYLPLALSVIELSSQYPAEGGFYIWTKNAFGERAGFLSAWTYWVSNLPYFPAVLYFAASNILFVNPQLQRFSQRPAYFAAFAVTILALLTALNIVGLNLAKWAHNLGALAMWAPVVIILVLGIVAWRHFGSANAFTFQTLKPGRHLPDMIFWSVVIFSFIGCESASLMAEEIKDAQRNIPRALMLSGVVVAFCYIVGTFAVLLALPSTEATNLDGLAQAIERTCSRLHVHGVTSIAALLIAVSNIGAAGAYLAAAARLPFVAGLDGYLPKVFGQLHSRFRTPWASVLAQGLFGVLFVFLGQAGTTVSGAYNILVAIAVAVTMVPFLFLFASMVRLQKLQGGMPVIRIPGGRPIAILAGCVGFATAAFATFLSLIPPPEEPHKQLFVAKIVLSTAALIGVGALLYFIAQGRTRRYGGSDNSASQ